MLHKTQNFAPCDLKCWLMWEKWIKITFKMNVFSVVLCVFVTTLCTNIWDQKVQNSVFYETFLPITWIKPRAGIMKYSKCVRSHVMCDIKMPRTVWLVCPCSAVAASCFLKLQPCLIPICLLMWSIYENNSFLNCSSRWKWRMIIAVNFPI